MPRKFLSFLAILGCCFVPSYVNADCVTIAEAAASANLTALTTALDMAGLTDTFNVTDDTNAYTVCAPTNDAFMALATAVGGFDSLTTDQAAKIKQVLLAHAVKGSFNAATLAAEKPSDVPTLADGIVLATDGSTVTVGGNIANIVKPDAAINLCGGSIVHIIDAVMLPANFSLDAPPGPPAPPSQCMTIAEAATAANLTALVMALDLAGLTDTFDVPGDEKAYTLCAPNNDAFTALAAAAGGLRNFTPDQVALIKEILLAHAVEGAFDAATLAEVKPSNVPTLAAGVLLSTDGATVTLGGNIANIVQPDAATNLCGGSIVHIVDAVMLPPNITVGTSPATPSNPPSIPPSNPPQLSSPPPGAASGSRGLLATFSAALATLSVLLLATV